MESFPLIIALDYLTSSLFLSNDFPRSYSSQLKNSKKKVERGIFVNNISTMYPQRKVLWIETNQTKLTKSHMDSEGRILFNLWSETVGEILLTNLPLISLPN